MRDNNMKWFDRATESAVVPSLHLMPQWLSRLLEDCGEEAESDNAWPLKLITKEGRSVLWCMCTTLGVDTNGVPGQACRLLERYLAAQIRIYVSLPMGSEEWEVLKRSMTSRLPLLMVSCIQLAAKMNCADLEISSTVIRARLGCKGLIFTVNEINDSEFSVFSMLGFRVPLWTSVEVAEALAVDAGLPQTMLEGVAYIVDISEFRRDLLDRRVRWAANLEPSCAKYKRASMRTLHLAAGAVVACARYLSFAGPDPAPRLADLTRAPLSYIRCISHVILSNMLVDDLDPNPVILRKSSSLLPEVFHASPCKRKRQ